MFCFLIRIFKKPGHQFRGLPPEFLKREIKQQNRFLHFARFEHEGRKTAFFIQINAVFAENLRGFFKRFEARGNRLWTEAAFQKPVQSICRIEQKTFIPKRMSGFGEDVADSQEGRCPVAFALDEENFRAVFGKKSASEGAALLPAVQLHARDAVDFRIDGDHGTELADFAQDLCHRGGDVEADERIAVDAAQFGRQVVLPFGKETDLLNQSGLFCNLGRRVRFEGDDVKRFVDCFAVAVENADQRSPEPLHFRRNGEGADSVFGGEVALFDQQFQFELGGAARDAEFVRELLVRGQVVGLAGVLPEQIHHIPPHLHPGAVAFPAVR